MMTQTFPQLKIYGHRSGLDFIIKDLPSVLIFIIILTKFQMN